MLQKSKDALKPSPAKVIIYMLVTIVMVIVATELLEAYFHSSELFESILHISILSTLLVPLFYFFWFLPFSRQLAIGKASEEEIRNLSHQLMGASERERRKLARDLHDVFGQKITTLQLHINNLQQTLFERNIAAAEMCLPLTQVANDFSSDLRQVLADLRPATLDELGLAPALESLCNKISQQQANLNIHFRCVGITGRLDPEVEIALYRACQESLTNSCKHANAEKIEVCLSRSYPSIILTIRDDGNGFSQSADFSAENMLNNKFGLVGMRERIASIGGSIHILAKPKEGVRIRIEVLETQALTEGTDD